MLCNWVTQLLHYMVASQPVVWALITVLAAPAELSWKSVKYWLKLEGGEEQMEGRSKQCEGGCCGCECVYMWVIWGWGKPGEVSHLSLHRLVRFLKKKIKPFIWYRTEGVNLVLYCKSLGFFFKFICSWIKRAEQIEWGHQGVVQQWPDNMTNCRLITYDCRKCLFLLLKPLRKSYLSEGLPPESVPNMSTRCLHCERHS